MAAALWGRDSDLAYLATQERSANRDQVGVNLSPILRKSYETWRRIITRNKELGD